MRDDSCVTTCCGAAYNDPIGPYPGKDDALGRAAALIKSMDTDADGMISREACNEWLKDLEKQASDVEPVPEAGLAGPCIAPCFHKHELLTCPALPPCYHLSVGSSI